MDNKMYMKIADEICEKLILLWKENKTSKKTLIELYNELLDPKYHDYQYQILSYIPEYLAIRGYEIINSSYFEIKKY